MSRCNTQQDLSIAGARVLQPHTRSYAQQQRACVQRNLDLIGRRHAPLHIEPYLERPRIRVRKLRRMNAHKAYTSERSRAGCFLPNLAFNT